jgi:hypothetical protein
MIWWIVVPIVLPIVLLSMATHRVDGLSVPGFLIALGATILPIVLGLPAIVAVVIGVVAYIATSVQMRRRSRGRGNQGTGP